VLDFESLLRLGPHGLVVFCYRSALRADEVMRTTRYQIDWQELRATAYRRGLDSVREWIVAAVPTPELLDGAGQAATDAVAAAQAALMNAIDGGDDSNGARAVLAPAEGMTLALTMLAGEPPWTPAFRDDFFRRPFDEPRDRRPDAAARMAIRAVEQLERVNPYEKRGRLLPALHDDLTILVDAQQGGSTVALDAFGPLWAWDSDQSTQ